MDSWRSVHVGHELHRVHNVPGKLYGRIIIRPYWQSARGRYNQGLWSTSRMSEQSKELRPDPHGRAWPLYGAAFMMAISLSMAWTAMPFVLSNMGGTNAHVGYAPAVNTLAYMIALLVAGSRFGHLRVRRTTLAAATVALLAAAVMSFCVLWAELHVDASGLTWIWALIAAGGVGGAAMALYWPFLMSWVSADYEGVRLNGGSGGITRVRARDHRPADRRLVV
jgi:hypothetical protein